MNQVALIGRNVTHWFRSVVIGEPQSRSRHCGEEKTLCQPPLLRGLRRGSTTACLLGLQVRIPPGDGCLILVSVLCVFR